MALCPFRPPFCIVRHFVLPPFCFGRPFRVSGMSHRLHHRRKHLWLIHTCLCMLHSCWNMFTPSTTHSVKFGYVRFPPPLFVRRSDRIGRSHGEASEHNSPVVLHISLEQQVLYISSVLFNSFLIAIGRVFVSAPWFFQIHTWDSTTNGFFPLNILKNLHSHRIKSGEFFQILFASQIKFVFVFPCLLLRWRVCFCSVRECECTWLTKNPSSRDSFSSTFLFFFRLLTFFE